MTGPLVTILVPNYKTLELTKLCLRLLRKYTAPGLAKVIVIDNDSQDASLEYLRRLVWIDLIERKSTDEIPVLAHARALDAALARVTTPYVLSLHTDSLVKHPDWLPFLIARMERDVRLAGIGSWKLEAKPTWRRSLKWLERQAQHFFYRLLGSAKHPLEGVGKNYYYLRSHCALYRTELLRSLNLHFSDGDMVAGKAMHKALVEAGYRMEFLPSDVLIKYVDHVNHATTILNPHLSSRQKSVDRGMRRIKKSLASVNAEVVLRDESLDV